jgi:hypothetical protein
MLIQLASHSPDLAQLIEEEYDLELRDSNLLVHHVPYVTAAGNVLYGILVSELTTNGERTVRPGRHEMWLVGEVPYNHQGIQLRGVINEPMTDFGDGLSGRRMSLKRNDQHPEDYYIKVTTYVDALGRPARAIDPQATHRGGPPRESSSDDSPFRYHDGATSRAALSAVTAKLKRDKIAIVGLGGTGSYILDLLAKTPVAELHLYDDDVFHAHNAFRSPGAARLEDLVTEPTKVEYLRQQYDGIRRDIFAHPIRVTSSSVEELADKEFVFLAVDTGPDKRSIVAQLEAWGKPFVDCGIGVTRQENSLRGMVRITAAAAEHYDHLPLRLSYVDQGENEYNLNIQTVDLNMLNAVLAVLKWKKMLGYYVDEKDEYNSTYTVSRNQLVSGNLGT